MMSVAIRSSPAMVIKASPYCTAAIARRMSLTRLWQQLHHPRYRLHYGRRLRRCRVTHAPNNAADIVADQQRAVLEHQRVDRPALRLVLAVEEAGQQIDRLAGRMARRVESDIDDLV